MDQNHRAFNVNGEPRADPAEAEFQHQKSRVLDLLTQLQRDLHLTYLFIGHDLAVIQRMSHDVLVMRDGAAVEYRPAGDLFDDPEQDYTRTLLAAVPPARPRAAV